MLKYGNIINVTPTSKSLLPRNLTFSPSNNVTTNNFTTNNTTNSTSSNANFNAASITDLTVQTINVIGNTSTPNIVISSPVAFSILKSDYSTNNYNIYPIYISLNTLINNVNLNLNTNNLTIKDNVFVLNNNATNITITNNTTDEPLAGFIFPIGDRNNDTDYYGGLLYFPNSQIQLINPNSSSYYWTGVPYKYFTNTNKGFFKFKYISQNVPFTVYQNNLNTSYVDLVNNTNNLSNILVGSIGCGDGEIVSLNNYLTFKISDGINNPFNTLTITKSVIEIFNNLSLIFQSNLKFQTNNTQYINLDDQNKLIHFYKNILLDLSTFNISFNNTLNFVNNNITLIQLTNSEVQFNINILVNNITIISSLILNNIPINFTNSLQIVGNGESFMTFDAVNNLITFNQPSICTDLRINGTMQILNNSPIIFSNSLSITDTFNNSFINITSTNINLLYPTNINNLIINTSFQLNSPIVISTNFIVQDNNNNIFIKFNSLNNIFLNNLYFNKLNPTITFDSGQTLSIEDTNKGTIININNGLNINGPIGINTTLNTTVNSSFSVINSIINNGFNIYTPQNKLFIISGITNTNNNSIILTCNNVCTMNLLSGTILGTTRSETTSNICIYNINIWSYIDNLGNFNLSYNSLLPINTNNKGTWIISNITLDQPNNDGIFNINIICTGSDSGNIIWGFKVDILSI